MGGVERESGNGPEKPSFWRTGGAGLMRPDPRGGRGRACSSRWRGGGLTWVMADRATAAASGSEADQREHLGEERRQRYLQIIWAGADVDNLRLPEPYLLNLLPAIDAQIETLITPTAPRINPL